MEKDEKELLATAGIKGDESALLKRIDADKDKMYGIAYSYMRNQADALEAVQETVCRVWIKRKTLREPKYFTTWMMRILITVCMDERKKQRREYVTVDDRMNHSLTDDIGDETAIKIDMGERVKQLPNPYRMVVVLKYYRDLTITDIAELLEKPDGTIRTWLNKGLKLLRIDTKEEKEVWEEYGRTEGQPNIERVARTSE